MPTACHGRTGAVPAGRGTAPPGMAVDELAGVGSAENTDTPLTLSAGRLPAWAEPRRAAGWRSSTRWTELRLDADDGRRANEGGGRVGKTGVARRDGRRAGVHDLGRDGAS